MGFDGFGADALPFLKALAFHQSREWFEANRETYERHVKTPLGELVGGLSAAMERRGLPLRGDAKASVFRINRDIRFSKDKSPYKTATSCLLTRSGTKNDPGVLYVHIDPMGCFVAAGFHHPEPAALGRLRRAVARTPAAFLAMTKALATAGLTLSQTDRLTRLPRGFEDVDDPTIVEALKHKSYICSRPVEDASIGRAAFVDEIVAFTGDALHLLEWGWRASVDSR